MAVDRCYCRDVTFEELRALAAQTGADVDRLGDLTGAGTGCGLCRHYIRVVLATGRTSLPVLTEAEADALCARGRPASA